MNKIKQDIPSIIGLLASTSLAIGFGAIANNPEISGLLTNPAVVGIGASLSATFLSYFSPSKIKKWFIDPHPNKLNHDIQRLFVKSVDDALNDIFILFKDTKPCNRTINQTRQLIDRVQYFLPQIFTNSSPIQLDEPTIKQFLYDQNNEKDICSYLESQFEIFGITEPFKSFFSNNLPCRIKYRFDEGLKDHTNNKSWIAFQRMLLEEIRKDVKQIAENQLTKEHFDAIIKQLEKIKQLDEKPSTFQPVIQNVINLDPQLLAQFANENLKEELKIRDEMIAKLNEELNRKNLPQWEQDIKYYLAKGEIENAIESLDTDASDEEAAQKHIRKAELHIITFQFAQAEKHYNLAVSIFPSYNTNFEIARFYYYLKRFNESILFYNNCLNTAIKPNEIASTLNDLGLLHADTNSPKEAFQSYTEALKIYMDIAKNNPSAYLPCVAGTLNNLGSLQSKYPYFPKESFQSYTEALKIFKHFAEKNPEAYRPDVAMTLTNLGNLQSNFFDSHKEAFQSYTEALKIYMDIANNNPSAYLPCVAGTLNNLGSLQSKYPYFPKEAFQSYTEALKIFKDFAEKNPDTYRPDVAMTLNGLGTFHSDNNDYKEALECYTEALKIYRDLADKNPVAYIPDVATTLNNLGTFHQNNNDYKEALDCYTESMEIKTSLAEKNPGAYKPDVANTLNNLGALYSDNHDYKEALECHTESLEIRRDLASQNPSAYLPDVASSLFNLCLFYKENIPNKKLSLKYAKEAKTVLNKCNDSPFVTKLLNSVRQIIKYWNQ